jgi:hypothetical protein
MTADTPTPAALIASAREHIVSLEQEVINLGARRRALLMAGGQTDEITKFDLEHSRLKAQVAAEEERIAILSEQIHQEHVAEALERKGKQIDKLARKLKQSDKLALELEAKFGECVGLFRKLCRERGELISAFQSGDHEVAAAVNNAQGAALSTQSIGELMAYELYRQGAVPPVPGQPIPDIPSFPLKAICPRLELTSTPNLIKPFSEAIAQASEYAAELLKTGRAPSIMNEVQASPDGPPRTAAQMHLNELLAKMAAAAQDPAREAEYMLIVQQVAVVQDKVEMERQAVSQAVAATAEQPKGSPAEQRLDALRRRSVKMVYAQESNSIEYAKLSAQIAVLTAELKQQGVTV